MKGFVFVSPHSLLEVGSGAATQIRTLLEALVKRNIRAVALHATVFDDRSGGSAILEATRNCTPGAFVKARVNGLEHVICVTQETRRERLTSLEEERFWIAFRELLDERQPDVLIVFGGLLLERAIILEAKRRSITVAFGLFNGNYRRSEVFEDVHLIFTDSAATASLYRQRFGLSVTSCGIFMDSTSVRAERRAPKYITFINPCLEKGLIFFLALARAAEPELPEATFLVVESRGKLDPVLKDLGEERNTYRNVRVLSTQSDMRPVYGLTKVLLVPSLWHESGGRVIAEALINGIPVLGSDSGGIPEAIGEGGLVFALPSRLKEDWTRRPSKRDIRPWLNALKRLVRDETYFGYMSERARRQGERMGLERNVDLFLACVAAART